VDTLETSEMVSRRRYPHLLIVTHEAIGEKMAGPGVRAWEMACALSDRFEVTLAVRGEPSRSYPGLHVVGYDLAGPSYQGLGPCVSSADAVLAVGPLFAMIPALRAPDKPAIVDLYGPFELEMLSRTSSAGDRDSLPADLIGISRVRLEGSLGDFFICASERQRDFYLGALLAAGRINSLTYAQDPTLRALIDVVPFGLPPQPPRKQRAVLKGVHSGIEADDKVLLWNGGIWQWFAPGVLLDALVEVLNVRDDVKLFFAAGEHFDSSAVSDMPVYEQTRAQCRKLGLLDRHVFFGDWIPYDERGDYLLEADIGVSVHSATVESRFAFRTRLIDCVWAGLPVIATGGDSLSELIAERGLGRLVAPDDPRQLAEAILETLADPGIRVRVDRAAAPVRRELAWAKVVEPIAAFLDRATLAPDALQAARVAADARRSADRIRALEEHIEAIYRGRVMRLVRAVNAFLGRK